MSDMQETDRSCKWNHCLIYECMPQRGEGQSRFWQLKVVLPVSRFDRLLGIRPHPRTFRGSGTQWRECIYDDKARRETSKRVRAALTARLNAIVSHYVLNMMGRR